MDHNTEKMSFACIHSPGVSTSIGLPTFNTLIRGVYKKAMEANCLRFAPWGNIMIRSPKKGIFLFRVSIS